MFGTSGGNPAAAIVPEPVDYETDQIDVVLGYLGKKGQFELGYHLSLFRNDKTSLTWENPFTGPWAPAASFPAGLGRLGLPPDNEAHQITFSGGYTLGATTRVTATMAYGRMTQDDDFLPFTINPGLLFTTTWPRSSLDGEI